MPTLTAHVLEPSQAIRVVNFVIVNGRVGLIALFTAIARGIEARAEVDEYPEEISKLKRKLTNPDELDVLLRDASAIIRSSRKVGEVMALTHEDLQKRYINEIRAYGNELNERVRNLRLKLESTVPQLSDVISGLEGALIQLIDRERMKGPNEPKIAVIQETGCRNT